MRDFQQSRLYRWEDECVISRDEPKVPFDSCQALVDHVWHEEGYKYPPKVTLMPAQNRRAEAKADRLRIMIPKDGCRSTVLLHEIAHSLTAIPDEGSCMHGPRYVGVYLKLLSKYAGFDLNQLCMSCMKHKIEYNFKGAVI